MKYRKATMEDLSIIMDIIKDARSFLATQNSGQWQDGYPNKVQIINDINQDNFYVVLTDDNDIASVCALTYQEEDYERLYEGHWISDYPYMVMHRCAVKDVYRHQGYGNALFSLFETEAKNKGYKSIRIDTHEKNIPMRNLILKNNFVFCGRTILKPDKDRMVFEKIIEKDI